MTSKGICSDSVRGARQARIVAADSCFYPVQHARGQLVAIPVSLDWLVALIGQGDHLGGLGSERFRQWIAMGLRSPHFMSGSIGGEHPGERMSEVARQLQEDVPSTPDPSTVPCTHWQPLSVPTKYAALRTGWTSFSGHSPADHTIV